MLLKLTLVALASAVLGIISLQMAIAPGYVAPLFPPAGIAVAAAIVFGFRAVPAIFAGSFAINLVSSLTVGLEIQSLITATVVSLGACLQSLVAAGLLRRFAGFPAALDNARTIVRFLVLAAPVACLVNASISVPTLIAFGVIPPSELTFSWMNWWAGDALGVLVFSPLVLALLDFPSGSWRGRRRLVVWPLMLAVGMLTVVFYQIGRWESERVESTFQRDARGLSQLLISRVSDQLYALHATRQTVAAQRGADPSFFHVLTEPWLARYPGLHVIGWAPRVEAGKLEAYRRWAHTQIDPQFEVFWRDPAGNRLAVSPAPFYLPITLVEPVDRNRAVLGLDPMGFTASRPALETSMATGKAVATEPIRLQQEAGDQRSVVVYQVVREVMRDDREGRMLGMVYVGLRMGDVIHGVMSEQNDHALSVCLFDATGGTPARLFGAEGCEGQAAADGPLSWLAPFDFAERRWVLSIGATAAFSEAHRGWASWVMLIVSPLAVGLLGAFLLVTSGHTQRVEALVRERTAQLEASGERLREGQAALARAQALAQLGSWELDPRCGKVHCSEQMRAMFHLPPGEVERRLLMSCLNEDDRPLLEEALLRLEGAPGAVSLDCRFDAGDGPFRVGHFQMESEDDGNGRLILRGTVRDVTEARAADAHIQYLARFDPLTGLPNRSAWTDRVKAQIQTSRRHDEQFAVMFIDLDHFKTVNDSLGHALGDRLLAKVAGQLRSVLREDDLLARQGGDEFVALLTRLPRPEDAAAVARKMLDVMARPFGIDHHELVVSVSIGIAMFPQDASDADTLITQADLAMYSAKESGRNAYAFFHEDMNAQAQQQMRLYNALRRALERDEFSLAYQPQVDAQDGRVLGFEALLRWQSVQLGHVPPDEFIPIAETSGQMLAVGEWVLKTAFEQQARWRKDGLSALRMAVNISALQFRHAEFVPCLERLVRQSGADPRRIELEITESALMQMGEGMVDRLHELRRLGFTLALDDFGTGYSSLAYLKRFPIERLKIDRSFVRDLPGDPDDCAIAMATISMARDLGMEVVAEGVETEAQHAYLVEGGCQVLQGYLFGRPMPAHEAFAGLAHNGGKTVLSAA